MINKHRKWYFDSWIFIWANSQAWSTPHNSFISFLGMMSIMTYNPIIKVILTVKHLQNVKF